MEHNVMAHICFLFLSTILWLFGVTTKKLTTLVVVLGHVTSAGNNHSVPDPPCGWPASLISLFLLRSCAPESLCL